MQQGQRHPQPHPHDRTEAPAPFGITMAAFDLAPQGDRVEIVGHGLRVKALVADHADQRLGSSPSPSMVATADPRLTDAEATPGVASSADCTDDAHPAQCIPETRSRTSVSGDVAAVLVMTYSSDSAHLVPVSRRISSPVLVLGPVEDDTVIFGHSMRRSKSPSRSGHLAVAASTLVAVMSVMACGPAWSHAMASRGVEAAMVAAAREFLRLPADPSNLTLRLASESPDSRPATVIPAGAAIELDARLTNLPPPTA